MKKSDFAEFVSPGHPDRLADAIADKIVEEVWHYPGLPASELRSLAGIEVAVHDATVFIDGRVARDMGKYICPPPPVEFAKIVREVYRETGYGSQWEPAPDSLEIITRVCEEALSDEEKSIRPFSDDQNVVHGYAINRPETCHLPAAHWLAHLIGHDIDEFRRENSAIFGPDFKVFVDVTDDGHALKWRRLVLSLQHAKNVSMEEQHRLLLPRLKKRLRLLEKRVPGTASSFRPSHLILNGAGDFVTGGPRGDNGLSGKKLVIDHYGPSIPIGGGAMVGKDPWKVDRCGPLRARQLAKRLARAGNHEAQVTLGWAPGEAIPSLRDARVRPAPGGDWKEVPEEELPEPQWFAIESIFNDLLLGGRPWSRYTRNGVFLAADSEWERC